MAPTPLFMGPFLFRALARSFTQLVEKKIQYANEIDLAALVVISFLLYVVWPNSFRLWSSQPRHPSFVL